MLGRSRGGVTTKIHLACDGRGLPLAVVVAPGNVNDSTLFGEVMNVLRVPRAGVPASGPQRSSQTIRQILRRRDVRAVIAERVD